MRSGRLPLRSGRFSFEFAPIELALPFSFTKLLLENSILGVSQGFCLFESGQFPKSLGEQGLLLDPLLIQDVSFVSKVLIFLPQRFVADLE